MFERARAMWAQVRGDGCTAVPDFTDPFTECCNRHDADYRTHVCEKGQPISRYEADKRLLKCLHEKGLTPMGRWFVAPLYFVGVRLFGRKFWRGKG